MMAPLSRKRSICTRRARAACRWRTCGDTPARCSAQRTAADKATKRAKMKMQLHARTRGVHAWGVSCAWRVYFPHLSRCRAVCWYKTSGSTHSMTAHHLPAAHPPRTRHAVLGR